MSKNVILIIGIFLAGFVNIIASLLSFLHYKKTHNNQVLFASLNWFCWGFGWLLYSYIQFIGDQNLIPVGVLSLILGCFSLLIATEYSYNTQINSKKIVMVSFFGTLFMLFSISFENLEYDDFIGFKWSNVSLLFQLLFLFLYILFSFTWIIRIYNYCPPDFSKKRKYMLYSGILKDPIPIFLYLLGWFYSEVIPFAFLVHALGVIFLVLIIRSDPGFLYILPYEMHRLMIIDRNTNSSIYEFIWSEKDYNKVLLTSIISGILQMSREVLFSGELDELHLRESSIIFSHYKNYSIIVFVSKLSNQIKESLKRFNYSISTILSNFDPEVNDSIAGQEKRFTDELINSTFPHF